MLRVSIDWYRSLRLSHPRQWKGLVTLSPFRWKGCRPLPLLLLKFLKSFPPLLLKGGIKGGLLRGVALGFFLIFISSCEKNPVRSPEMPPRLFFEPDSVYIAIGQKAKLTLQLDGVSESIFALSLQVTYNEEVISFSDSSGFEAGDFFPQNALVFVRSDHSRVHLSISKVDSQLVRGESSTIGSLTFTGLAAGSSPVQITPNELYFYNDEGEIIDIPALELNEAVVQVR